MKGLQDVFNGAVLDTVCLLCLLQSGSQENLTVDSPRLSTSSEHVQKERTATKGRGILRSSSGKAAPVSSDRPPRSIGQPGRPTLRKAESTRVRGSVPVRSSLSSQAKATSVSERLDSASSTLPRASSVISTAEGTTRRTSIHDLLSKDNRQPVSVDVSPPVVSTKAGVRSQPTPSEYHPNSTNLKGPLTTTTPLPKSLSLPCHSLEDPDLSTLESFLGPSFTVESVFMDSIFSESAGKNLPFLSLNPTLVSNISGPPVTNKTHPPPIPNHIPAQNQAPHSQSNGQMRSSPASQTEYNEGVDANRVNNSDQSLSPEDNQSLWYEYGCVWMTGRFWLADLLTRLDWKRGEWKDGEMTNPPPLHVFIRALSVSVWCICFVLFSLPWCWLVNRCFCFFSFCFSALFFSLRWDFDECSSVQQPLPYYCFLIRFTG